MSLQPCSDMIPIGDHAQYSPDTTRSTLQHASGTLRAYCRKCMRLSPVWDVLQEGRRSMVQWLILKL